MLTRGYWLFCLIIGLLSVILIFYGIWAALGIIVILVGITYHYIHLESNFKTLLDKNPQIPKDYAHAFLSIYNSNYPTMLSSFGTLLDAKRVKRSAVEKEIETYFKDSLDVDYFSSRYNSKPIYDLSSIKNFVRKYGNEYKEADLQNLEKLLIDKGIKFHNKSLVHQLIHFEQTSTEYTAFKMMMLEEKPLTKNEFIIKFLKEFDYNDDYVLKYLYKLLEEEKLIEKDFDGLKNEVFEMTLKKSIIRKITINDIDMMNGYKFEEIIGKLFQNMGYLVEYTPLSNDQGADLILTKYEEKKAVQVKNYTSNVSNSAIQQVVAAKKYYGCNSCIVITNSYFTKSAIELGNANGVKLIDRDELQQLINEYF